MGYISRNIASITEPKIVSLSAQPNFVQFASLTTGKTYLEANVKVNINAGAADADEKTVIIIKEYNGAEHSFHGSDNPQEVGGSVFYISVNQTDTAENLRQALLTNRWIEANFDIVIPAVWVGSAVSNGDTLNIKSKGAGTPFNITILTPNNTANVAYTVTWVNIASINNDTISGEAGITQIELDVYDNPAVFLGADDRPINAAKLGTLAVTLQKTYAGVPLWFDLNTVFARYGAYNKPALTGRWFNTGTARAFRFVAKIRGINSFTFYQSNALFVLNGYGRAFEGLNLSEYIYSGATVKLLSNKPRTPYVRGQREYLNFILSDANHGTGTDNYSVEVIYSAYSSSDQLLGTIISHDITRNSLSVVNSCRLAIDSIMDAYPDAGIIRVALGRAGVPISNYAEYTVRPDCLHDLHFFVFLNRLGGWDTFNFDNIETTEVKPLQDTFVRSITPAMQRGDSIETVYSTDIEDPITIEGAPVSNEVAEWLKELAAARAIFDEQGNYLIKEDFVLRVTDAARNMQIPTMRYRLSETYTND